ncbi:FAD-binding oxidoreductase [Dactylosporangium vinaceum]|nr:FAD-binding oxidoreductase [Dactylosporangium vinaceum]
MGSAPARCWPHHCQINTYIDLLSVYLIGVGSFSDEVVVVGAGVTGLTTAVHLAENGLSVVVYSRDRPGETTSCAAAAFWGPHMVDDDRAKRWGLFTLERLIELAARPGTGVEMLWGVEAERVPGLPSGYLSWLPDVQDCGPRELPDGFRRGWRYETPVVEMPEYLSHLEERFRLAGGRIEIAEVASLSELADTAAVIVNCAGHGAGVLASDGELEAVRGEIVVVEMPGLSEFFIELDDGSNELTYFVPQGDRVVLGGTWYPGRADTAVDWSAAREIVRRCARIEPRLSDAKILDVRVGIRPVRSKVRLERVDLDGAIVIHNYGHGGGGVGLSWGCARDAFELVTAKAPVGGA